jgi:hypothetical protein
MSLNGGAATRSACSTNYSPSRYLAIDKLLQAVCSVLSRRHIAHKGGPLTALTTRGGYE